MKRPETLSAVKLALAARQARLRSEDVRVAACEPLAITGMACRLPAGASTPDRFWALLEHGVDAIETVPRDRWDIDALYDPDPNAPGKMNTRYGAFLSRVDGFDAAFFGIAPREAASMDPQQRLLLEVTWEALDDAGLPADVLNGSRTGVFFAVYGTDYAEHLGTDVSLIDAYTTMGTVPCMSAGRVSFLRNLTGPSLVVDTACSSSLVALHLAAEHLRRGACDRAIVGGASLLLMPNRTVSLSRWGFMAPDGRCKAFDARADGWVRGEGGGVVVLERLSDALANGGRVLAVVRGTASNQDGRSTVLTAPNGAAQEAVIREALRAGAVDAADVTYVEAHGTGTEIGDPIELDAIRTVLGEPREDGRPLLVGTAKSNIGHLEAAAGITGVIKTVLALQHETIPASLHFQQLNPHVSLDGSRVVVARDRTPWRAADGRRFAGVSAFGFSGTNAHAILEEAPEPPSPGAAEGPFVLTLSARSDEALADGARAFRDLLVEPAGDREQTALADICYTAAVRRTHYEHRLALVGSSSSAFVAALDEALSRETSWRAATHVVEPGHRPRVVFVFSGQGPQWIGMGRELAARDATFRAALDKVARVLDPLTGWSLAEELAADANRSRLDDTSIAQPALFALQMALAETWAAWGIEPTCVIGHSLGEVAAAAVAGMLTLEDAAAVIVHRSRLMARGKGLGRMVSIDRSREEAERLIASFDRRIGVAAVNGPTLTVVSGDTEAIDALAAELATAGISHQRLPVDYAFHSHHVEPLTPALLTALSRLSPTDGRIPLISTVTGTPVEGKTLTAAYWARNLREPVLFSRAVAAAVQQQGEDAVLLEVSAHPVLSSAMAQTLDAAGLPAPIVASLHRKRGEWATMLDAAARLHARGAPVRWDRTWPARRRVVSLPPYAWQRQRLWVERDGHGAGPSNAAEASWPGQIVRSPAFEGVILTGAVTSTRPAFVADHVVNGAVLMPAVGFFALAWAGARAALGRAPGALTDVELSRPLVLAGDRTAAIQTIVTPLDDRTFATRIVSAAADGSGSWIEHASAKVDGGAVASELPSLDAEAIERRCTEEEPGESHYAALSERGYAFGPRFRALSTCWRGTGEALGRLTVPPEAASERLDADLVHPGLLDSAMQVAFHALPDDARRRAVAWIPTGAEAVSFQTGESPQWAHAVLRGALAGRDGFRVDVVLADAAGRAVASVRGLSLAAMDSAALAQALGGAAESVLYSQDWEPAADEARTGGTGDFIGRWLVLANRGDEGQALAQALRMRGASTVVCEAATETRPAGPRRWLVDPFDSTGFARVLDALETEGGGWRGVVNLWPLDAGTAVPVDAAAVCAGVDAVCASVLHLTQALVRRSGDAVPPLFLVSRGAQRVASGDPPSAALQSPMWGFARSLEIEHPELRARRVDLPPTAAADDVEQLVRELGTADGADEVAWRDGRRWLSRIVPIPPAEEQRADPSLRRSLAIERPGRLEDLRVVRQPRAAPSPGSVEIEVQAAGLNFRDVLIALGMYPDGVFPLGNECAGVVSAVGEGVDLVPGDEVIAIGTGCLGSHVTLPRAFVARRPRGSSAEAAAALPVAYLTASYGLERLAHLSRGETVLIHAAAGGVGLAAVHLALRAGAEVIATVGSEEKRQALHALGVRHVLGSRSLDFAADVLRLTDGRGVDVALNSLAGDFIPATLRVVSRGGRFVEIGRADAWSAERMAAERPDVAYHPFLLGALLDRDHALAADLLGELVARLERGELPSLPHQAFALDQAVDAFRHMAQARHIGKIVLVPSQAEATQLPIRPDGWYVVTGGLGAIGRHVARWLVGRGARHIALLGRHAADPEAQQFAAELSRDGVSVRAIAADVSSEASMRAALVELGEVAPLRAVIHAAGSLADGMVAQQPWSVFREVLRPKVDGGAVLREVLRDRPIDFVLLFSSAAAVLGSPGQAAYAAGNAFLDALASRWSSEGVRVQSIDWGAWSEGGMASDLGEHLQARWRARGVRFMTPDEALGWLDRVMTIDRAQVAVLPIAWSQYLATATPQAPARFTRLRPAAPAAAPRAASRESGWLDELRRTAPTARLAKLVSTVRAEALKALGLPSTQALEPRRGLRDVGLDSLMAVELRNRLQSLTQLALPATLAFEQPNIEAIARHLAARLALDLADAGDAPAPTVPPAQTPPDDLAALSDAEAELALEAELAALDRQREGERARHD